MPASLVITGMTEFRNALRHIPDELASEAVDIVTATAEGAAQEIRAAYPEGPTGNLKRRVKVERAESRFGAAAIVRSQARHAHLYEWGTKRRQNRHGANRGQMPKAQAGTAMIPIAQRARSRMLRALVALVRRAGFEVEL